MKTIFTLCAALTAAFILGAADAPKAPEKAPAELSFKSNLQGLKADQKSEKIFVKTAPSLKLSKDFSAAYFYKFGKEAGSVSGKTVKVTFSAYREKGSVLLMACVRAFTKDNKYLGGTWPLFTVKENGKWTQFSFTYKYKPSDGISNVNIGFMLDNKKITDDVVYIDEPVITFVE